jgi:hypothetical protein
MAGSCAVPSFIDLVYKATPLQQRLQQDAKPFTAAPWLQELLLHAAKALEQDASASHVFKVTSALLADLREALPRIRQASARLAVLDLSLHVEAENFRASAMLRNTLGTAPRHQRVELLAAAELSEDGPRWDTVFGHSEDGQKALIRPDLDKLDLRVKAFVSLDDLHASDSGRIVGPKAAKLGELRQHFPKAVAPGVAIPFGLFRATVLDKPYKDSGKTVYAWMVSEYQRRSFAQQVISHRVGNAVRRGKTLAFIPSDKVIHLEQKAGKGPHRIPHLVPIRQIGRRLPG